MPSDLCYIIFIRIEHKIVLGMEQKIVLGNEEASSSLLICFPIKWNII